MGNPHESIQSCKKVFNWNESQLTYEVGLWYPFHYPNVFRQTGWFVAIMTPYNTLR